MIDPPAFLFIVCFLLILSKENIVMDFVWRKCGHRDGCSLLDFLNPLRGCPYCKDEKTAHKPQ